MNDTALDTLGQTIAGALAGAVTGHAVAFGELTLNVEAARIVEIATFLRDDPGCRLSASLMSRRSTIPAARSVSMWFII